MNILHINSYYSVSPFYKNLFDKQIEYNHNINVYVPVAYGFKPRFDYDEYTDISLNHKKNDRFLFHKKHKKILDDILVKYSNKKFDIVHAHSLFSNGYIALKYKEKYNVPYIVAVRNTDVNIFLKYMLHLRPLAVRILKEAASVIFLSDSYKQILLDKYIPESFKKIFLEKTYIIPNGIDDFWLKNTYVKKAYFSQELKIITAGNIDKNKNHLAVCNAINLLLKENINVKYTIAGSVKNKKCFSKIMKFDFVKHISNLSKQELINEYRQADIFVMPSKSESFGLVYAEAMSQGLPVIYTKCQGFDGQFVEGEAGYHVEADNSVDIAEKIKLILNKYDEISKNNIDKCKKFNWNVIADEYDRIYSRKNFNNDSCYLRE